MLRVGIVVESPRLRSELRDLLHETGRFEVVVATVPDSRNELGSARDGMALEGADVIVTDAEAMTAAASKGAGSEAAALVVLTDEAESIGSLRPLRTGIALLPATATADQIVAAIEAAGAGLLVLHADHAGSLSAAPVQDDPLTPREHEVLQMLAAGLGNKEIAGRLHISDHTAKFHVSQILAKLNAASRAEAVSIAMRRGLVPL
ncbi:MAG TPA: response regulator transcription factor [Steroidobacteraceae bacterium]|nr:response regulator transcription factor [Steroidobacteraceae bacterium]